MSLPQTHCVLSGGNERRLMRFFMEQYHIAYVRFIESMREFKSCLNDLRGLSGLGRGAGERIMELAGMADAAIAVAEQETFLPSSDLLQVTNGLLRMRQELRQPLELQILRKAQRMLHGAADAMMGITNDADVMSVKEMTR